MGVPGVLQERCLAALPPGEVARQAGGRTGRARVVSVPAVSERDPAPRPYPWQVPDQLLPYALDGGGGERLVFGEVTIVVRASSTATGGAFNLFEEVAPMVDTPLHVHERDDELFYVLEGEHVIRVGDDEFRVSPGGLVFAPRGVPHSQRRVVPGEGRLLVLTVPGGLDGFFRELAAAQDHRNPRAGRLRERVEEPRDHLARRGALARQRRPRFAADALASSRFAGTATPWHRARGSFPTALLMGVF
jgi:mannose-6-phosphate isomerase-like protein (cupin superfamily)